MKKVTFHLLANAHLDPVWLWDWREGLNEGIITVRAVLDLMDKNPELTFMRGESAIYEHIEKTEPETFDRIRKKIREGRWEIIGGSYIQPDTNLTGTETMVRHYTVAQTYFRKTFGHVPRIAWAADSFGHSGGLPEILVNAGMTGFACTRPMPGDMDLEHPAFWWEGESGARVLGYRPQVGWYGTNRDEVFRRFDEYMKANDKHGAQNIGFFYGVGNHGGGPTRRQLDDIRDWASRHPEVDVIHSGLHRLFDALTAEEKEREIPYPVKRGELNFCLRGCYVSVAKFKFPYRRAEAQVAQSEKTDAIISAALDRPAQDMTEAWKSVLFNSFHDILPGTSIERAFDDQIAWVGSAYHAAQRVQLNALNALAAQVDTSVPKAEGDYPTRIPLLVWNPNPMEYSGPVELEGSLDYRPITDFENKAGEIPVELVGPNGKAVPFQVIHHEHNAMHDLPWRRRVVFQAQLPPLSWSVYQLGWARKKHKIVIGAKPAAVAKPGTIQNSFYRIAARKGAGALQIFHKGKPMFPGMGFSVIRVNDPEGSWGGRTDMQLDTPAKSIQEKFKITAVELTEQGPERAAVWVRFAGRQSRLDLTFHLARGREVVDVRARVFWNERNSRLKLVFPVAGCTAEFEVPGGHAQRGVVGEVPALRWARVFGKARPFGFASDSLYGFKCEKNAFQVSIVRASHYAGGANSELGLGDEIWRPAVDAGELNFRFLITADLASVPRLAQELDQPIVHQPVPAHAGMLPASGSLFSLQPAHVGLLALKPAEKGRGFVVRVQEIAGKNATVSGSWLNQSLQFGMIPPWSIRSFLLTRQGKTWNVKPVDALESAS